MPLRVANEIWIADDNQGVRLLFERGFERCGTSVIVHFFNDGAAVLDRLREGSYPKLLLLDVRMPIMSGLEVLIALRDQGHIDKTTVVMFSGIDDPVLIRAAYFSGASLFLSKPAHVADYAEIAKLCSNHVDAIRQLRAGTIPFGAFDVKRVFELFGHNKS